MTINKFGGSWTEQKIQIVEDYAKAYLKVMKNKTYWKLLYFDGFAGTGDIDTDKNDYKKIEGAAKRILNINEPRPFDMCYFVELDKEKATSLENMIKESYPNRKNIFVVTADCNDKLLSLSNFLKKPQGKNYKVLIFIDPFGMELNWESLESLRKHDIDLWILIPTGLGANRLLKKDGNIPESWINKLEKFLGIPSEEIMKKFYQQHTTLTLFGPENKIDKEKDSIEKLHELYKNKLNTIFQYVSDSFVMRNSTNSIMFHFLMATNNKTALKIANSIIKPKYKL